MGNKKSILCCDDSVVYDNPLYNMKDETSDICTICNERNNFIKILQCKHNMCKTCFNFEFFVKNSKHCPICHKILD